MTRYKAERRDYKKKSKPIPSPVAPPKVSNTHYYFINYMYMPTNYLEKTSSCYLSLQGNEFVLRKIEMHIKKLRKYEGVQVTARTEVSKSEFTANVNHDTKMKLPEDQHAIQI